VRSRVNGEHEMLKLTTKAIVAAAILMWPLTWPAWAQPTADVRSAIDQLEQVTGQPFQGLPNDWSNHHLVFSEPDPSSSNYDAVKRDPRYLMQVIRRSGAWQEADPSASFDAARQPTPVSSQVRIQKDWTMFTGGSASSVPSSVVNTFPAKYSFSTTSQSCSDFAVYMTEQRPSSSQPSIVVFNNLYKGAGCGSTVPTVSSAYNTSGVNTVTISTSPSLSLAGDQIAIAQGPNLILLKLAPGSGTIAAPVKPPFVAASSYRTCTAPCLTTFDLTNSDGGSSPYVDYTNDAIYVGDAGGRLYKFSGVFLGTPAIASGWSSAGVSVTDVGVTDVALSSPVFDSTSGQVFLSDLSGGFLFSVTGTTPSTQVRSGRLSFNGVLNSAPLVDSTTENVYYFSSADSPFGGNSGVFQMPASFTGGATGSEATVGTGAVGVNAATPNTMFSGSFDNTYFTSSGSSGNLYTCGNFGGNLNLYKIPIVMNVMRTPVTGPTLVSATGNYCSPITEFDNGTDLLFFSVSNNGTATSGWNCAGKGCVLSFNINNPGTTPSTPAASTNQGGSGGSTGLVVDNNVSGSGGAQVYFLPLANVTCTGNGSVGSGTGVCATQASQAALQ
jgi:hypothetical protein